MSRLAGYKHTEVTKQKMSSETEGEKMNKTSIFTPLSPEYIAGFFDGEGSAMILTIRRKLKRGVVYRFRPVIKISQKTESVLVQIMNTLKAGHIDKDTKGFTYIINGLEGVLNFCQEIVCYSIVKCDALVAMGALASFQRKKRRKNEPYTLDDTDTMIRLRDKVFYANSKTRTGLKQKYGWLQIMTETNFVADIEAWKENRMRGIRRLHNEQSK